MTRVNKLKSQGTVASHGNVARLLSSPGDYAVVERGLPRSLVLVCPDGCGEILTINLDPRSGKAWRLDRRHGELTLYPSIWRKQGCKSHFIIWRDLVRWCDGFDNQWVPSSEDQQAILQSLANHREEFVHYEVLAEECSMNPWDAAWAGSALKRKGKIEVRDDSYFRLSQGTIRTPTSTVHTEKTEKAAKPRRWRWWPW
jgi:hypothetical protein